jgi:hypothetical protein
MIPKSLNIRRIIKIILSMIPLLKLDLLEDGNTHCDNSGKNVGEKVKIRPPGGWKVSFLLLIRLCLVFLVKIRPLGGWVFVFLFDAFLFA